MTHVDLCGSAIPQALVKALMIVEVDVVAEASIEVRHGLMKVEIDMFVFDGAPETFVEDVVESPATAVHADANARCFQAAGKVQRGDLRTLVTVEDCRLILAQGILQRFQPRHSGCTSPG